MKLITNPKEIHRTKLYLIQAAYEAEKSKCKKSKRGVVIVKDEEIIGRGYNEPTIEELCCMREHIKDNSRVELCSAVHAEQMAIATAVDSLVGSTMYHIKVKDGIKRTSGKPSCTICSRMIYISGIKEFILWHKEGYAVYTADELNRLSFRYFVPP